MENNFKFYYIEGIEYLKNEDFKKAIDSLNLAIKLNPNLAEIFMCRGFCYKKLKKYNEAINDYNIAIQLNPNLPESYIYRGDFYDELKEYSKAINNYNIAIQLDPNSSEAYFGIGNFYIKLKQYNKAINNYNTAVELNPNHEFAYLNRGNCFEKLQEHEKAIIDYTRAISLNQNYSAAYINRGVSYFELKQYDKAINDCNIAIQLNPTLPVSYNNRADSYLHLKQYDNAINDCNIAIQLNPNYTNAYNTRGISYEGLKEYDKAINDFNIAIQLDPSFPSAYLNRGFFNYFVKNNYEALKDINACVFIKTIKCEGIKFLNNILEIYENQPQNVQFILDHFEIDLESLVFNPFEAIIQKNNDLNFILSFIKKGDWYSVKEIQIIEAIFRYYMGGCLTTYEILDNKEKLNSNQEYYYWALCSKEIIINFREDFETCLKETNHNSDLDLYYIGLLYILKDNKIQAIDFFRNSKNFVFSKIMLAHCLEYSNEKRQLIEEINQLEIDLLIENIDFNNKLNFNNYFHYFECQEVIQELKNFSGLKTKFEQKSFQSYFKLDIQSKGILGILSYSIDIQYEIKKMYDNFDSEFETKLNPTVIKDKLDNRKEKYKDIFDKTERNIKEGKNAENELRSIIESFSTGSKKFYSLLIAYYYAENHINKEQTFFLTLFLIKIIDNDKEKQFDDAVSETNKTILDTAKTIISNITLKVILGLVKNGAPKFFDYLNNSDDFDKGETEYYKFKENIILYFKREKNNLSEDMFKEKYKISNYFINIDEI